MNFKFTTLCVALAFSANAHSAFNVFNNNGTTLDVSGEVNLQLENKTDKVEGFYKTYSTNQLTDRRTRFGNDDGDSWIEFRGSQTFGKDYRATGVIGYGYKNVKGGGQHDTLYLAIDKKNFGSIGIGRQYLHTGYVYRTSTFSPLHDYGGLSTIRADYTRIKNLHLSAFYGLPDTPDTREGGVGTELPNRTMGLSFSYLYPFGQDHSLRVAGGYTKAKGSIDADFGVVIPEATQAVAGSLEYKKDRFIVATDFGSSKSDYLPNDFTNKSTTNNIGLKLGYLISPRLTLSAGYGIEKGKRKGGINTIPIDDNPSYVPGAGTALGISEYVPDSETKERYYLRGDFYARENVRFYARYDNQTTEGKVQSTKVSATSQPEYRLGLSLTF